MADIAQELGISKNAVSLGLNNKPGVSDQMRSRILELARKRKYFLENQSTSEDKCIVVIVPAYIRDDGSFYSDVFWAIEHEIRRLGLMILTAGLTSEAEERLELPLIPDNMRIVGYLAIGIIRKEYLQRLYETGKTTVCVDIRSCLPKLSSVGSDNLQGGYFATEYLIKMGHRHISFAGPVFCAQSVFERWCGYRQAMLVYGLVTNDNSSILGSREGFQLLDDAEVLARHLSNIECMPSAWFCAGDMIAVSMLRILENRGLRVPKDVSIVGFDDLKVAELVSPPLTTMHVDRKAMGRQAVHLLMQSTEHTLEPLTSHILLPATLVERQSVAQKGVEPSIERR